VPAVPADPPTPDPDDDLWDDDEDWDDGHDYVDLPGEGSVPKWAAVIIVAVLLDTLRRSRRNSS